MENRLPDGRRRRWLVRGGAPAACGSHERWDKSKCHDGDDATSQNPSRASHPSARTVFIFTTRAEVRIQPGSAESIPFPCLLVRPRARIRAFARILTGLSSVSEHPHSPATPGFRLSGSENQHLRARPNVWSSTSESWRGGGSEGKFQVPEAVEKAYLAGRERYEDAGVLPSGMETFKSTFWCVSRDIRFATAHVFALSFRPPPHIQITLGNYGFLPFNIQMAECRPDLLLCSHPTPPLNAGLDDGMAGILSLPPHFEKLKDT
ncbi:hypothetical protein BDK51DRAFT_52161 [Blyttiomyces helicus]|uniref:Uncharacterized protein n=1 Tax=Blyttiomyces helicus TaxID=388810 RepID=A0A4P9WMG9_9FUNG|nr:hypothetical protein BDK51DRAFT_52161 [Blyttiomyces helicus]|eukprot:RKO92370.1 hypothetical protein BDK51DRAFT_52161 [Blyttiomyces helicus]